MFSIDESFSAQIPVHVPPLRAFPAFEFNACVHTVTKISAAVSSVAVSSELSNYFDVLSDLLASHATSATTEIYNTTVFIAFHLRGKLLHRSLNKYSMPYDPSR